MLPAAHAQNMLLMQKLWICDNSSGCREKGCEEAEPGLTEVVEDAGLLVANVIVCDCFSREDFSPATSKNIQLQLLQETNAQYSGLNVCVCTMRWEQQPPGLFPWELDSGGNVAGQSTSSVCYNPRNPSLHLLHSVNHTHTFFCWFCSDHRITICNVKCKIFTPNLNRNRSDRHQLKLHIRT